MALQAKVIRGEKPAEKKAPHRIVLLFYSSSDGQRAELGRYIMHQQIVARKKKNQEVDAMSENQLSVQALWSRYSREKTLELKKRTGAALPYPGEKHRAAVDAHIQGVQQL